MMKIVHITSVHPATDTRILYKECATLAAAGHDVHLVAPGPIGHDETRLGVHIHYVRPERSRGRRIALAGAMAVSRGLSLQPDLLHFHDPELLPHVLWARARCRRIVYDMHEDLPKSLLTKHWIAPAFRGFMAGLASAMERALLGGLAVVYAEDSYRKSRPWIRKFATVHNMPILTSLENLPRNPSQPPSLGYIGSISPARGCLTTLDVLAELQRRGTSVAHDCIGELRGDLQAEMIQRVQELKLDNVRFHGYQPADQGYRILAGATLGLALLHPEPNYIESYPTKMFEYMAMGIPVVVSDFPLYRQIVEDTGAGIVVNPLDVKGIADAIQSLLADDARLAAMGMNGRAAVKQKYSWEHEAASLLRLYADS
jgi:glycosyltransferase involved in cell wall biosynthesis